MDTFGFAHENNAAESKCVLFASPDAIVSVCMLLLSKVGLCVSDLTVAVCIVDVGVVVVAVLASDSPSQNCACDNSVEWFARCVDVGSVADESAPIRSISGCAVGLLLLVRFKLKWLAIVVVVAVPVAVVAVNPIFVLWLDAKFSPSYVCCGC